MTIFLSSEIEDKKFLRCTLSTDAGDAIVDPVLCFSVHVPIEIFEGGCKLEGLGGFTAVKLFGKLKKESPLHFALRFEDPTFRITNRSWHPLGPYLRTESGTIDVVSDNVIGVHPSQMPTRRMPKNGLALVPAPTSWTRARGALAEKQFRVRGEFSDIADDVDRLCVRRNLPTISGGSVDLVIRKNVDLPSEHYRLVIGEDLTLDAGDRLGALYGLISLISLREVHDALPRGEIVDGPRFEWRGFMLDCAREFYPVSAIMKLLDLMALLKLNRFHWHFADDEAFRLEVDTAPELWKRSGFRGEGQVLPALFGGRPGPTGGTYSKADVSDVIQHARALGIEVLPEIEFPAHALALTTIRPDLRDPNDRGSEVSVQGYARNVVNPALDATWDLMEPLAKEVAALFPFGHLHLGGDELPDKTWEGSSLVDGYKADHGLRTHQDVQGHMMERLASKIRADGITPCAWQEAADGCTGGVQNEAILFSWTGAGPGREAAQKGYRVVMCPAQHAYFDMAHSAEMDDWGANWAATYALDKAFEWDPIPDDCEHVADRIIGVQGTFWSEFTCDARNYEGMIAPRILGLATKAWSRADGTTLVDLKDSATCYAPFLSRIDWLVHHDGIDMVTPDGNVHRIDA